MSIKKSFALLLAVVLLLPGCAGMNKTEQGAAVGVGVGAATGAVLGQAIGRNTSSTVIGAVAGAAAGGLIGGAIGNYMDRQEQEMRAQMARMEGASVQRYQNNLAVTLRSDVLFDVGSSRLKPGAMDEIYRLADILNRYPDTHVDIGGHTDSTGSEQSNFDLSERRAMSVADALASAGVTSRRIAARGFGETRPVATNATEAGRQQNRRVVIDVIPNQS
jgi:outer membrane protein OmpA-like peptidoglycan-associated protein